MTERHITAADIEEVLAHHHLNYPDKKGNRILIGRLEGRRVKVVVAKDSAPPHIITVGD